MKNKVKQNGTYYKSKYGSARSSRYGYQSVHSQQHDYLLNNNDWLGSRNSMKPSRTKESHKRDPFVTPIKNKEDLT